MNFIALVGSPVESPSTVQWRPLHYHALQRKSHLCIPRKGIARPQSQFPPSCVCERFIYSQLQDRSTYNIFLQQNRQRPILGIYSINRSHTHEYGNWDCGRAIPFLGIFVSNFQYCVFAVCVFFRLLQRFDSPSCRRLLLSSSAILHDLE